MYTFLWKEPPQVSEVVVFAKFRGKYHIFLNIKMDEWNLKMLLFSYRNDLVLDSVEKIFFGSWCIVSLTGATVGFREGCFCWIWLEISHFFKYKNGWVGPKSFVVELVKWFSFRQCRNIVFLSWWIRVSKTSHCRWLRGSFFVNLTGNITFF